MPQKTNLNIILIGIDTLRADHLGCYGYQRPTSPTIDAFSKESIFFQNCFSQAPNTAPSFMSIMTSLYPSYHGLLNIVTVDNGGKAYVLPKTVPTLAEILHQNGYRTAAFTDGGQLAPKFGFNRGFDFYSTNQNQPGRGVGSIPEKEILYFLELSRENDFFLFFQTYAVHNPWSSPWQHMNSFTDNYNGRFRITDSFPEKIQWLKDKKSATYTFFLDNLIKNGAREDFEYHKAIYDGAITYIDAFFAKLMNQISKLGLHKKTVVIFTADHGEEFMDHGMLDHLQLYNELLHVPLMIYAPDLPKIKPVTQIVRSIDILPTILDISGIRTNAQFHGVSLMTALNKDVDLQAIAETEREGFAIQNKKHKFINHAKKSFLDELYDLKDDPAEQKNIAFENLDLVEELRWNFERELHRFPNLRPRKKTIYLAPHLVSPDHRDKK